MITWWYGHGWRGQFGRVRDRLTGTASFFSIGQLFSTLFSPFRQISAGGSSGPLGVVLRAFIDSLISRVIGAIVRLFTIFIGVIILVVQALYELIILVFWLFLPIFPVIGLIIMAIGWVPRWM
ncbi:MAG: hypothetical protein ACSLEY_01730 [Candidatus Saccharimonadales bacterium]